MLKNSFIALIVLAFGLLLFHTVVEPYKAPEKLNKTAEFYNANESSQIGAANVVTAVVVTYRGLDTLGEVTVLFLTASVIGFFLKRKKKSTSVETKQAGSELMSTASKVLVPGSIVLGAYVFVNGHLTPGGGFQGGAVIGTAILLLALANPTYSISKKVFHWIESISGFVFVGLGVAGILLAGGFLDSRILPNGQMLSLLSAGVIPLIYSMIGLKVGSEISGIVLELNDTNPNQD